LASESDWLNRKVDFLREVEKPSGVTREPDNRRAARNRAFLARDLE
jgi:hypothetical protein